MTSGEFVIRALFLGYFLAGIFLLMAETSKSQLERTGFLIKPTFVKKSLFVMFWFVFAFQESYYVHLPHRAKAIVYGLTTPPAAWFGFSLFGALILLPHLLIESVLLAVLASAALVVAGSVFLAPILAMLCALLVTLIAKPIVALLPKARNGG